jgi:hypothetical protein
MSNIYKQNLIKKWFNLNNYKQLESMSTENWVWQLEVRYEYFNFLEKHSSGEPEIENELLKILDTLKQGIIPPSMGNEARFETSAAMILGSGSSWKSVSVKKLSSCENQSFWNDSKHKVIFEINLTATDNQIKKEFDSFLEYERKMRKFNNKIKDFSKETKKKWVKDSVLPCLDVYLISLIKKIELSNADYFELIFPPSMDTLNDRKAQRIRDLVIDLMAIGAHETISMMSVIEILREPFENQS